MLGAGVADIVTLEYGRIFSEHPQIKVVTPAEFTRMVAPPRALSRDSSTSSTEMTGTSEVLDPLFDIVVSYSSLEHSGLGRYGDALNPWGDVMQVARAWCVTRKGGLLILGLPDSVQRGFGGKDKIVYNAHRVYGDRRWPYVSSNWKKVGSAILMPDNFHAVNTYVKE